MPTLFPPDYPDRPDAPLLSFGPSFAEEIARSVIHAIWHENHEQPHETEVRHAAGLTMLEAFHPRDQLECMLAAQGVALHCAIMESLRRAMLPDTAEVMSIKQRSSATQMCRSFSATMRDLERRQAKPVPERPAPAGSPPPPGSPPNDDPMPGEAPRTRSARVKTPAGRGPDLDAGRVPDLEDVPDVPEDVEIRPDGTPGNLMAYVPKPPVAQYVPEVPAIMLALATRQPPYRMVNAAAPEEEVTSVAPPDSEASIFERFDARGPIDLRERIYTGDGLARFASARFDPDAPIVPLTFDEEDSVVDLELISTGGDPEAETERRAMIAAHPEGKPIVTFRYGKQKPPGEA